MKSLQIAFGITVPGSNATSALRTGEETFCTTFHEVGQTGSVQTPPQKYQKQQ